MKKVTALLIASLLVFSHIFFISTVSVYANVRTKTRTVNIVYDDSGSMAYKGVTSWSQAKYAMEVFASMMGENDTMNIFPMSSYSYKDDGSKSDSWEKIIEIAGSEKVENRVSKIDQMNGDKGIYRNTPIQTVSAAGNALRKDTADEKWLVILTDGRFDKGTDGSYIGDAETIKTLRQYTGVDGINVAYVAIGDSATSLTDLKSECFYPFDADANNILDTVTEVARTVFNYQLIPISGNGTFSFNADIPVSKVIVFAQGKDAKVEKFALDGKELSNKPVSASIQVIKGTKYYPKNKGFDIKIADGLVGRLVTYQCENETKPFSSGTYSFSSNVKNIEVYFEPGVDIQAVLENANGDEVDLSREDISTIEAGTKTVHLKMVNPLTGDMIKPGDSTLLEGAKLTLTVTDKEGNTETYGDGDTIVLQEGGIEVYAKASFRGDIEKSSKKKTVEVTPAGLDIAFVDSRYEMDIATLELNKEVLFDVKSGDGVPLNEEELSTAAFEVSGCEGVNWKIEATETSGRYKLEPTHQGNAFTGFEDSNLKISCTLHMGGVDKKGAASTNIASVANSELSLKLTMELPDANVADLDSGKHYMFDPEKRGFSEVAPYIKANVEVINSDGTTRPLTEKEWNAGVDGFSFSSRLHGNNIIWKIINSLCRQTLNFDVEKDSDVSSYRLYLSGLTAAKVRPHTSDLTTHLKIKLSNGLVEEGGSEDLVTVKPLSIFRYIGRIAEISFGMILAIIFALFEIRKNRFDRSMCPNTTAILTRNGVSQRKKLAPEVSKRKIQYKIMPPWKDEERDITLKYPGFLDAVITFHCVAVGGGSFRITNPKKFEGVKDLVRFNGVKYDVALKNPIIMNLNDDITINIRTGNISGKVIMYFVKQDDNN